MTICNLTTLVSIQSDQSQHLCIPNNTSLHTVWSITTLVYKVTLTGSAHTYTTGAAE